MSIVSDMHGGIVGGHQRLNHRVIQELLGASGPTPAQSTASLLGRWGCSRLVWRFWLSKDGEPSLTNPSTSKGTMSKAR